MAAAVLVNRETPTSLPTSCAACQADLQQPKTASHICGKCSRKYCSACYIKKMQLEDGTDDEPPTNNCSTCDRLIQISIMSQKTDVLDDRQTNIINGGDHLPMGPPRKSVRSNKTRGNTLTSNADKVSYYPHPGSEIQNGDPDSWSIAADADFGGFCPRTRIQRDKQGLASMSQVPEIYDNRYEILNSERNEANISEKHGRSVQHQNFGRYSNFGQHNQKAHTTPLSFYGRDQHSIYHNHDDWDEEFEDNEAHDEFFHKAQSFMHEKGHPDYNRTQFEQNPFSRSRSRESSGSRHYNPRATMLPQDDNNRPIFGNHPHTTGIPNTTRAVKSYRGEYYDDPLLQEDDIEDLVNVPAIDDIPYALFLAGKVDNKTLIKASKKQQQLNMLKLFKEGREQIAKPKSSKNKNSGLKRNVQEGNVTTDEILATKTTNRTDLSHNKDKDPSESMQPYIEKLERQNHPKMIALIKLEGAPLLVTGADKKEYLPSPKETDRKHSSIADVKENVTNSSETREKTCSGDCGSEETEQHLDSDRTESEKERFIREKRLQVLKGGNSIKGVGKYKNEETSTSKVSNRDRTYQLGDSNKPVKSKAFKSPVPSFQSLTGHKDSKHEPNTTNQTHKDSEKHYNNQMKAADRYHGQKKYNYQTNQGLGALEKSAKVSDMIRNDADEESGTRSKPKSASGNIDNNNSSITQQKRDLNEKSDSKETMSNTKCHGESGEYDESNSESAQVPLAMRLLMNKSIANSKSDNTTRPTDSETATEPTAMRLLREANAAKERQKEWTDIFPEVSTFKDDTELRNPEEPTAMRLLRRANTAKENKKVLREMISRVTNGQDDEEPQNPNEPTAMRLLRETKTMNERMKARTAVTGSSGNNPMVSLLSSLLGPPPSDFNPFTRADSPLSDRSSPINKPNRNKNRNKNSTLKSVNSPKGENRLEKYGSAEEHDEIHRGNRTRAVLTMGLDSEDEAEGNIDGSENRKKKEGNSVLLIATTRHKAFQKLKLAKGETGVRCTGCGRPDCQSQNIRKMKEVIQIAQQAGFEVRDVIPDGNCMFAAVVDQLNMYGDNRFGHKSLREAAVTWLIEHPYNEDGTHYSSFMSEDWQTYIQRMMAEGEWGDHVVLRAVVEVVGHTIKVLNVSENESHWTVMEPVYIDASKDSMHLVLGHVGEFHYISLRPCDKKALSSPSVPVRQESVLAEDVAQVKLEGTETVNMFKEDYIDVWSEMPVPHFSFLLTRIIPMKVMETAAILSSQYMDIPKDFNKITASGRVIPATLEYGGSIAEAVYCPDLYAKVHEGSISVDMYIIMTNYAVVEQSRDSRQEHEYVFDTSGVHAGYANILHTTCFEDGEKITSHILSSGYNKIMDQTQGRSQTETSFIQFNRVLAHKCLCWPEIAKPWVARERLEGWPSEAMISEVVSDGCLLTPFPHSASKSPDIEWQFSFALTERKLFRDGVSKHQKYCYILLDALYKQTMQSLETISSSHLKSVFFYACERIPSDFWETSPGACVVYMFDELLRYVNLKNLPNYFIQSNNMIDHLSDAELKEIEEKIILLRTQPVFFLRQIDGCLRMLPLSKSIIDKVSSDFRVFKAHKSVRTSTLEVFIPETIKVAQQYITCFHFELGFNMLSQAFQDRLSVSTCDDSVPFNVFLQGAVSGLDLTSVVWFSAYADKQLQGQLPMSLMRETCGQMTLVKIKEFLPSDVAGSYGDTEIPLALARQLCSFCHDYARFLFSINKMSEILPVLYHCHAIYPEKIASTQSVQNGHVAVHSENKPTEDNDFTDEAMFNIYTAMYFVYYRQHQLEFFRSLLPTIETVCDRINKRWALSCLAQMYTDLQDQEGVNRVSQKFSHAPNDPMNTFRVQLFQMWPNYRLDFVLSNQIKKSHHQQTGATYTNYQ